MVINTTSRSKNWSRGLSPFVVGPCRLDGLQAENVENAWQYSKVYDNDSHYDWETGFPTEAWYTWRAEGFASKRAERYPMGKGAKPVFSWLDSKGALSYIDARREIYVPLYATAVVRTDAFKQLQELAATTDRLYLWDFDGYDAGNRTFQELLSDPKRSLGHAFVLKALLTKEIQCT